MLKNIASNSDYVKRSCTKHPKKTSNIQIWWQLKSENFFLFHSVVGGYKKLLGKKRKFVNRTIYKKKSYNRQPGRN